MSSTLRGRRAPHVLQAPGPTPIERSVSAALGRPSQPSASAKTAPLRTSSMMLTRHARHVLLGRSRMLIAQRVWHAKALLTPALALNAHHVMVNSWSTVIERSALRVVPVLVPMSSRQIASSVWTDGIQRSGCASSALSRMSSLLTELVVWPLRCAQRAHNVQIQVVVTIKMTARPALLAPSAHLEGCVTPVSYTHLTLPTNREV